MARTPRWGWDASALLLAHLAAGTREVHLLQWDVARPVFEACEAGRAYPQSWGVTHPVIRRAAGLWARSAVAGWDRAHDQSCLLIGEVPLIGNRLIELTQEIGDAAEAVLASDACRFVLALPSRALRRHIEAERRRRTRAPRNEREREDATPEVLRDAWRELAAAAAGQGPVSSSSAYDPSLYQAVYQRLLRARKVELLPVSVVLELEQFSTYDYGVRCFELKPSLAEAESFIGSAERIGPLGDRIHL